MLPVYFEDRLVGEIREAGAGLSFAYDSAWRAGPDNFAISLTMPFRSTEYAADIATPWFANLLPEDRILEQTARLLGRSQGDVYGLLEEIGAEAAGALSIGRAEPLDQAAYRALSDAELADIIDRLPARPLLAGDDEVTMSLAGAQTKLAVAVFDGKIALPLHGAASTHILKPASDRLYATVENEFFCMRLAAGAGLDVAAAEARMTNGRSYLLVERYDRKPLAPGRVTRLHQEDFCQALGLYPTQKYQARRGPGLADLFRVIDAHARRAARDRLALLDLIILACCIGDTDRHGKNYSLLLSSGAVRLAPAYDLISALAYEGITRNLAMTIADKNRAEYLERRHWERFAVAVGLSPAATVRRVEALASELAELAGPLRDQLTAEFPLDRDAVKLFGAKIQERARRVASNSWRDSTDRPKNET
jgi:serine/threonine-protein kinase HipA